MSHLGDSLGGEWPQRDRTQQTDLDALLTSHLDSFLRQTGSTTKGYDNEFSIVAEHRLVAYFLLANLSIFLLQVDIASLHHLRLQLQRSDDIGLTVLRTSDGCPRTLLANLLLRATRLIRRQHDFLHHLSDDTIRQNHGRITILESQLESQVYEVGHLLY